ncbi:MAG: 2Fe-2S iron-sulfur cluster binding domain-containing protein, partial [Eggerthellaceae bacterium]|nr:2Fe-2S iron-sulfur cluster binding domain-containing protein [Eggerthellaceae bacterium]
MKLYIDDAGRRLEVEAQEGQMVLDVLQRERVDIRATCGGVGKCGRCQVLIRDEEGLNYRLACTTPVADGMEVVVERAGAMEVLQSGAAQEFPLNEGASGYGMAIDIGTTTVVAHLHDLATGERLATVGRPNPQIAFGSDVISRISASVDGKLDLMTSVIMDALREMKAKLCATAHVPEDEVKQATIAGNTVMQHIAAGLPPDTIGGSPFTPLSLFGDVHDIEG